MLRATLLAFLVYLTIAHSIATFGQEKSSARPTTPGGAKVPEAVRIKRPTEAEVATAKAALAKFIKSSDVDTQKVLTEFPSLVEVRVPRPNSAIVPNLAGFFRQKHQRNVEVAKQGTAELLFMGDSITDFWRNESGPFAGKKVFDENYGKWNVANFGIAGDTTQGVLYRLQNGEGEGFSPRAIMLMIGTNNTNRNSAAEIAEGIGAIVLDMKKRFAEAKILLLAVFPRSTPNDPVREKIAEINSIISGLHDGDRVHYLDIGANFLDDEGKIPRDIMADALHPSAKGYEIWADAVREPLEKLMQTDETVSLKRAVGDRFRIGVGVGHNVLNNAANAKLIKQHFQILTPENCMKPQGIHPAEDRWNFERTDAFADFARKNDLELVGHCLVWAKDDRTDEWMMKDGDVEVGRDKLLGRIETHVKTVVERYADVATMWDVVNEAIGDSNEGLLRDSVYTRASDIDFMVTAFKAARAADPDALLIYNDYNGHKPGKREKLIEFLTKLKELGAPVDAYGMQGHFELGDDSIPQLRETFGQLRELGLKVVVSELDIDVVTRGRWWADGGKYRDELKDFDPYKDGVPPEIEKQMAEQYVELFQLFDEYKDVIARVSFWNLHDGESWLNSFPWRRVNYPLLFDRNLQPKPAFNAVIQSLTNPAKKTAARHETQERTDKKSRIAHEHLLAKTKQGKVDVYFQGDSITRRWGATDYPRLLAHWKKSFHGWNAANFAWGGDNTHHILWRMQNGELENVSPKVICLQAGANNLPWQGPGNQTHVEDVVSGIDAIVAEFRERFPNVPVVLTGMFPRDQNSQLADTIDAINLQLESKCRADENLHWININDQLVDDQGKLLKSVSSDGLHLEAPGYDVWFSALRPVLTQLLGPPAQEDQAPPPTGDPGN